MVAIGAFGNNIQAQVYFAKGEYDHVGMLKWAGIYFFRLLISSRMATARI